MRTGRWNAWGNLTGKHHREWPGLEPLPFDERAADHDDLLPALHTDPFDRGLVCQAILNGMTIATPDEAIA